MFGRRNRLEFLILQRRPESLIRCSRFAFEPRPQQSGVVRNLSAARQPSLRDIHTHWLEKGTACWRRAQLEVCIDLYRQTLRVIKLAGFENREQFIVRPGFVRMSLLQDFKQIP
jgi:hypothetical protein